MADDRTVPRAIDALRHGWPVRFGKGEEGLTLAAIEPLSDAEFSSLQPTAMLLSGERATTLKLTNQRDAAEPGPVLIAWDANDGAIQARAVADPALDLRFPLKGPFRALPLDGPRADAARAAVRLARQAGLLPALMMTDASPEITLASAEVARFVDPARLAIAARAQLPVRVDVGAEIVAFRSPGDPSEHVALILGTRDGTPPVVRLHSECLTGDVLGSLKCDCGPQLDAALSRIAGAGWGVLLYLRQEGRGIGLINKLRAYQLQDQGYDTVDANLRLGFPIEARDFAIAARMLDLLGVTQVRLLTNNPDKIARLEAAGVRVIERLPLELAANPHNARYLATKAARTRHMLELKEPSSDVAH